MTRVRNCLKDWLLWKGTANLIGCGTLVLGIAGFMILWFTLRTARTESKAALATAQAAKKESQIALDNLHEQRARLTFGLADGRVAKYVRPTNGEKKGMIVLYFRNIGPKLAPKVLINAFSSLPPNNKGPMHHLSPYYSYHDGKLAGTHESLSVSVDAGTQYDFSLGQKWVPDPRQWTNIRAGRLHFEIDGTFEYCDSWRNWRCETFSARYNSELAKFVPAFTPDSFLCTYTTPDPKSLTGGAPGVTVKFLPPCAQPNGTNPKLISIHHLQQRAGSALVHPQASSKPAS